MISEKKKNNRGIKGHRIQPGQVLNPGGRKKLPDDIKAARHMAYEDMLRTVIDVRLMTVKDAKKINPESLPLGKRAILSAYIKVNHKAITEYENRLFGRAPETIQITDNKTSEDRDLLGALLGVTQTPAANV